MIETLLVGKSFRKTKFLRISFCLPICQNKKTRASFKILNILFTPLLNFIINYYSKASTKNE